MTIVSVFAKQNPLDLMISEKESNEGDNSQGFEVLTFGAHASPLVPLPADASWTACPALPSADCGPQE